MKIRFNIAIVIFFFLVSCKVEDRSAEILSQLNKTDTFLFDFPQNKGHTDSYYITVKKRNEKLLGLENLDQGYDSIQLRIMIDNYPFESHLLILDHNGNDWTGTVCNLDYEYKDSLQQIVHVCMEKEPKSGWRNFIYKLFDLQILSLPHFNKIPGYNTHIPMGFFKSVYVEIATKKAYRFYDLFKTDYLKDQYSEAWKMDSILHLIEKEFELNLFKPNINTDKKAIKPIIKEIELKDIPATPKKD